jgi:hypothetical protein
MASNEQRGIVQDDTVRPSSRRRRTAQSRPLEGKKKSRTVRSFAHVDSPPEDKPSDLEALRKARLNYINTPADERRKKMKYVGEIITREPAKKADVQHVRKASGSKRRRRATGSERKHRQHRVKVADADAGGYQSVYGRHSPEHNGESQRLDVEGTETDDLGNRDAQVQRPSERLQRTKRRRAKTGVARGSDGQDVTAEKQRQPARRRKSEPIERIQHVRHNLYGIEEFPNGSEYR